DSEPGASRVSALGVGSCIGPWWQMGRPPAASLVRSQAACYWSDDVRLDVCAGLVGDRWCVGVGAAVPGSGVPVLDGGLARAVEAAAERALGVVVPHAAAAAQLGDDVFDEVLEGAGGDGVGEVEPVDAALLNPPF